MMTGEGIESRDWTKTAAVFLLLLFAAGGTEGLPAEEAPDRAEDLNREGGLELEEALSMAVGGNAGLFGASREAAKAQRSYERAGNVFYPSVSVGTVLTRKNEAQTVSAVIPMDNTTNPAEPSNQIDGVYDYVASREKEISPVSLGVSVQGQLNLSPAMINGIRLAEINWKSRELAYREKEAALRRDVKKSFYNLLFLKEQVRLTEESLETMKAQYEQARIDYENGLTPELAMLNAQVAYRNMKPRLSALKSQRDQMKRQFSLLIGREPTADYTLSGRIELPEGIESFRRTGAEGDASGANPLGAAFPLRSMDLSLRSLKENRRRERNQRFLPALSLSASWMPGVQDPLDGDTWSGDWTEGWTDQGSLSLGLSLPVAGIFPASADRTKLEEMEDDISVLRRERRETERQLRAQAVQLRESLADSLENIDSLALNVRTAQRNYELTREGYRKGTQDFLALQNAEDEWNTAQANLLEEKLNCLTDLFEWEYLYQKGGEE